MALAMSRNVSRHERDSETPAELREVARRVRVLASLQNDDAEKQRLVHYAEELEGSAAEHEHLGARRPDRSAEGA
jgi:hypothetical protein